MSYEHRLKRTARYRRPYIIFQLVRSPSFTGTSIFLPPR